jgi:hypothetical protein
LVKETRKVSVKVEAPVKKAKVKAKNVEAKIAKKPIVAKSAKTEQPKAKPAVTVSNTKAPLKNAQPKSAQKTLVAAAKNVKPAPKNVKAAPTKIQAAAKKSKTVAVQKAAPKKTQTTVVQKAEPKKVKAINVQKAEPKLKTKPDAKISVKDVKLPKQKAKAEKAPKKTLTVKPKVQPVEVVQPKKKIVNKKAKAIGSAVFRGKKEKYDFQVFALDEKFEHVKAVYIISKRKTDRKKRAHHKLVYIGQTESIIEGIKEHKKDKCIKHNQANVICLLKEEDETNRLRIAADLREAHAIACKKQ